MGKQTFIILFGLILQALLVVTTNDALYRIESLTGTQPFPINLPISIAVSPSAGDLFFVSGKTVLMVNRTDGQIVNLFNTTSFSRPRVFLDRQDESIYVLEQVKHTIYKRALNGTAVVVAGTGELGYSGDGGLATKAQLSL